MAKKIKLWEGEEVEVNEQLMDDFDFISDLSRARQNNDIAEIIAMSFALIGGEKTYEMFRNHVIEEEGYFSQKKLIEVLNQISDAFPKAGNRAQRRSWDRSQQ